MKVTVVRKETLVDKIKKGIKNLFRRDLIRNKVYSSIFMLIGYCTIHLLEGDATVFLFTLVLGLPVFFAKENVID